MQAMLVVASWKKLSRIWRQKCHSSISKIYKPIFIPSSADLVPKKSISFLDFYRTGYFSISPNVATFYEAILTNNRIIHISNIQKQSFQNDMFFLLTM